MRKRYKIWLIIIVILIILALSLGPIGYFLFKNEESEEPRNTTSVILNLQDFGYTLEDRDTPLMQEEFNHLEELLKAEEIDYSEYAKSLAKLFIIDFYTLDNKINKYDVGGLEYILNDKREMFQAKAMDTIYNDIIDNTYNDRNQALPVVKTVEVLDVSETEITLNNTKTPSYKVTLNFTYTKDLGYDTESTIYLIKNNNRLEIALIKPTIE